MDTRKRNTSQRTMRSVRLAALTLSVVLLATGCGRKASLTEYVAAINEAVELAQARAAQFRAEGHLAESSTPRQVALGLTRLLDEVRIPLQEAAEGVEPPEQVAELHSRLWSWHAELIDVEIALARRFERTPDTDSGWAEFSDSPEADDYRASLAKGKHLCADLQGRLDGTADRVALQGVPWLPPELGEVVEAALGCEGFPDDPHSVYRYSV